MTLLIFFLLFEGGLRLYNYNPLQNLLNGREFILRPSKNSEMVYELTPGAEGYAWGCNVKINSHGFRDKEYSIIKGGDAYRIVAIGDSITFGNFMPLEETFSKKLESLFEDRNNSHTVEVLNLGVGGYDTLNEVAFLENKGVKFKPDTVILGYCINDLGSDSPNLDYILGLQTYKSFIYHFRTFQFIRSRIERLQYTHSVKERNNEQYFMELNKDYIVRIDDDGNLIQKIQTLKNYLKQNTIPYYPINYLQWYTSKLRVAKLRYAFEKLQRLRDKHKFNVVIVIIPFLIDPEYQKAYQLAYEISKHEAIRANFITLEMYDEFNAEGIDNLILTPGDRIHPNYLGHTLIANKLYRYLISNLEVLTRP